MLLWWRRYKEFIITIFLFKRTKYEPINQSERIISELYGRQELTIWTISIVLYKTLHQLIYQFKITPQILWFKIFTFKHLSICLVENFLIIYNFLSILLSDHPYSCSFDIRSHYFKLNDSEVIQSGTGSDHLSKFSIFPPYGLLRVSKYFF